MLQRFGNLGAFSGLVRRLRTYLRERFPNLTLKVDEIVHPDVLDQFGRQGNPIKIRLRRDLIPVDICDRFNNLIEPESGYLELNIVAKRRDSFSPLKTLFGDLTSAGMLTIPVIPGFEEVDQKRIEVVFDGRVRTLDVSNPAKIRSYFDVTDLVELEADGHPKLASISAVSRQILTGLWNELQGGGHDGED
jgi:hypothetical protein